MRPLRFVCVLTILLSATAQAPSNPAPPISQSARILPPASAAQADPKAKASILESYGKLPLSFEANTGQTDSRVKFLSRGAGYTLFLTANEAVFSMRGGKPEHHAFNSKQPASAEPETTSAVLRMTLVKANLAAKVNGAEELAGASNYFIGNDPAKWRTNVPTYAKVEYEGIYSGIDLVYYGSQRQLEYDFVVAPGADPRRIAFEVRGAKKIGRDKSGDLVLQTTVGEVRWRKPIVYQKKDASRQEIAAHYVIQDKSRVEFEVGDYDSRRALFIDPLIYSTYLGGRLDEQANGIAVDSSGNAYVTGLTTSTNFPTMNPLQSAYGGGLYDAFVTKLNPTGSALVYSTYLGGSGDDRGYGIAVDSAGNAYITGFTSSTNFPTMNPLQPAYGGLYDAFVTKINPAGSALIYSTYLGGSAGDSGSGIAVDNSGNAYVTGYTSSTNFPTMNALQPAYGGGDDAFITKINPGGSALVYSTYLGGGNIDVGTGIAVDSADNAYVTGVTYSTDFPTTRGAFQTTCGGDCLNAKADAFVAKLNPAGSALVYSTYLGGSGVDQGSGIAVDSSGSAFVTGGTASTDFPTVNPVQPSFGGISDAFVTQFNPTGSALVYSTYLGGSGDDLGYGITVDSSGDAFVTGYTSSTNFPTMNPLQPAYGGLYDAFVTKINPAGSALLYSTYLGGSAPDDGRSIAVDSAGNAYVTGETHSTNFPITPGAFQTTCRGCLNSNSDAFVTRINTTPSAFVTLGPSKLDFGNQTVDITSPRLSSILTNVGEFALTITSIKVMGSNGSDFVETDNCAGTSILPRGTCKIAIAFRPSATGTRTGAVSISDNAPKSPQMVSLTGVGVLPAVTFSPTSLTFPTQLVDSTSKAQTSTLTNSGPGILKITKIAVAGPFSQTNNCGSTLKPAASCTLTVTFKPTTSGELTGSIAITDNAPLSPQKLTLKGTGTAVQLTPTGLNFGNQPVGTKSLAQTITLSNKGHQTVSIASITITGTNAGDFSQTNTCGTSVASGASCFIKVTFKPTATGTRSAAVSVSDNGGGSPQKVSLTGDGT